MNKEIFDNFLKECRIFCRKYNKKDKQNAICEKLSKGNDVYSKKSMRFAIFYYELGENLKIEKNKLFEFSNFISFLANISHSADDLKDTIVLNTNNKINKIQLLLTQYEKMDKFLNALSLKYDSIKKGFHEGIELFKREEILRLKKKVSNKDICEILEMGSPDFHIYNGLLSQICPKLRKKILLFLKEYALVDLILDHISDIERDFINGSFNPILFLLKSKINNVKGDKLPYQLAESKTYDFFIDICFERSEKALSLLDNKSSIYRLLKFYINGEIEGLRLFKKYNYFLDFPDREKIIYLILKPHPWERYAFEEVFNNKL